MFKLSNKCKRVACERNTRSGSKSSVYYQPSLIEPFLCQSHVCAHDSKKSVRITSDIYMLFNAQRLDRQSREAILKHFDDMAVSQPALASLKSKLSDDQLISIVKSRYIQSPSELMRYSMYLNSLADSELQAVLAAQQAQAANEPAPADSVEPAPAPSPAV